MDNLPQDPFMLFSFINTMLRDRYDPLNSLCDDLDIDRSQLEKKLATAGFIYSETTNQFR